jgi:hypothetical protein
MKDKTCVCSLRICACVREGKNVCVCVCCVVQACAYVSELYEQKDRGRDFEIKKCIK